MNRFPKWLLLCIVIPRLALFAALTRQPAMAIKLDSTQYLLLAHNLLHSHVFSTNISAPFQSETMRTPGYPIFLLPFVQWIPSPVLWIIGAQLALNCLTCWIVWTWALRWGTRRAGVAAAGILGFDWIIMAHSLFILTETLFLLTFSIALLETWDSLEENPNRSLVAGFFWGLSALVRPVVVYLPFFLSVLWVRQKKWGAGFLLASYLLPGLWVLRNIAVAHYAGYTSIDGVAFLIYPAAGVEAVRTGRPIGDIRKELLKDVEQRMPKNAGEVDFRNAYRQKAMDIMRQHPIVLTIYCAHGAARILGGTGLEMLTDLLQLSAPQDKIPNESALIRSSGTVLLLKKYPALIVLQILYGGGLLWGYGVFALGLARLWKNEHPRAALLLVLTFGYIVAISSHQGYYRFRLPLMPLIAMGAAAYLAPTLKKNSGNV